MFKQFSHAQLLPLSKTKRTSNMQAVKKKKKRSEKKIYQMVGEIHFINQLCLKQIIRV